MNRSSATQQKERSYSADLSNLSGSERGTSHTSRANPTTGAKVKSENLAKDEQDPLVNLQPPQWSNSYYYHSPNNSTKSASLGRSPDRRPKKSRFGSDKGAKSPTNVPESVKHTLSAVSTDGHIQCTLLNQTQFTTSVSTRGDVCYLSETGFAPLHSTKTKNNKLDSYFLLLETPKDTLLVPLSGTCVLYASSCRFFFMRIFWRWCLVLCPSNLCFLPHNFVIIQVWRQRSWIQTTPDCSNFPLPSPLKPYHSTTTAVPLEVLWTD